MAELSRLEACVTRLEALEARLSAGGSAPVAAPPAPGGGAPPAAAGGGDDAPFVRAFDDLVTSFWGPVEKGSKGLGSPDTEKIVGALKSALDAQRAMLVVASGNKKPASPSDLQIALKDTSAAMEKVESLKDRRSKQFNHLAMIAEGTACLQWVCVEPTPVPFLSDVIPGSEMYGNKIIMEFKGKEEAHVSFAKDFKTFLLELQKYVKEHHKTGLSWNPSGGTAYKPAAPGGGAPAAGAPPPPPAGGPPPPPPPPPAGFFNDAVAASSKPSGGGHAALFAELEAKGSQKAGAAGGLRKVSKDEMTHKNPALRASSVVADGAIKKPSAAPVKSAVAAKKPPKIEQNGNKWLIENFEGNNDLKIEDGTPKTAVLFVKCTKSLLQVPGKINTLSIDSCVKSQVLVDSCVAQIEIINCTSVQIQVTGSTPIITMDGCSGVIVYLSKQCLDDDVSIVSSKCSEMNIVLPGKTEEEDPVEIPVPEQFETRVRNGKLETTPISHIGA